MNRLIVIVALACCTASLSAQIWDQHPKSLVRDKIHLSQTFLATNNIGFIEVLHQEKAPNRPIVSSGLVEQYYFNHKGLIIREIELDNYGRELKKTAYSYSGGELQSLTTYTGSSVVQKLFEYQDDQLVKEVWKSWEIGLEDYTIDTTYIKEVLVTTNDWNDTTEVFQYAYPDGRTIKNIKHTHNRDGYLLSITSKYTMGGKQTSVLMDYNDDGSLHQATELTDGAVTQIKRYSYHTLNLLKSIEVQKGEQKTQLEWVYDSSYLPKAILSKEGEMVFIRKYEVSRFREMHQKGISAQQ